MSKYLLACLCMLASLVFAAPAVASTTGAITPSADARVEAANPGTNFGTGGMLKASASPVLSSYLRFAVPSFTGTVDSVTLTLRAVNTQAAGTWEVDSVADDTWTELGLTYTGAPAIGANLAAGPAQTGGTFVAVSLPVTSVTPGGDLNLALVGLAGVAPTWQSKEAANAPTLEVTYTTGIAPVLSLTPQATPTSAPSVTFSATGTPTPTFTCALDGGAPAPCSSPYAPTGLSVGAHSVDVEATNAAGVDSDSTTWTQVSSSARYVSTAGNDTTGDGTYALPWRTISKAVGTGGAPLGADIYVLAGSYTGATITRAGTSWTNGLTIRPYPGDAVTVGTPNTTNGRDIFDVKSGAAYVTIEGLTISGAVSARSFVSGDHSTATYGAGVSVENGATNHVRILDNVLTGNDPYGVQAFDSSYVTVQGNTITDSGAGIHFEDSASGSSPGMEILDNAIDDNDHMVVGTPCTSGDPAPNGCSDDNGGNAIQLKDLHASALPAEVSGNEAHSNRAVSGDYTYDGGFLELFTRANGTAGYANVHDNILSNNENVMESGGGNASSVCTDVNFYRNVAWNDGAQPANHAVGLLIRCASNMLVANNTFVNLYSWAYDLNHSGNFPAVFDGLTIRNNIVSQTGGEKVYAVEYKPASLAIDHNDDYTTGSVFASIVGNSTKPDLASFSSWLSTQGVTNTGALSSDPMLATDYTLGAGSPAIDQGDDIAGVTDGIVDPDMGAYES